MYSYYDDFYGEPNEFERQIDEFKQALIKSVKAEHMAKLENLQDENARLSVIVGDIDRLTREIERDRTALEGQKEKIREEVADEFYRKDIGETLERFLDDCESWYAGSTYYQGEKCELCDDDRAMHATYPDGSTCAKPCQCAQKIHLYEPMKSEYRELRFGKVNSEWNLPRKLYLKAVHRPHKRDAREYDHGEFHPILIFDEFGQDSIKAHEGKHYWEQLAFRSEEECRKHCDWLNAGMPGLQKMEESDG